MRRFKPFLFSHKLWLCLGTEETFSRPLRVFVKVSLGKKDTPERGMRWPVIGPSSVLVIFLS
uniref:Uncharacterized protein n=1 Tax=Anguilla anguilla TaxID=7936 RepID=A0A0E9QQ09_ANGAN